MRAKLCTVRARKSLAASPNNKLWTHLNSEVVISSCGSAKRSDGSLGTLWEAFVDHPNWANTLGMTVWHGMTRYDSVWLGMTRYDTARNLCWIWPQVSLPQALFRRRKEPLFSLENHLKKAERRCESWKCMEMLSFHDGSHRIKSRALGLWHHSILRNQQWGIWRPDRGNLWPYVAVTTPASWDQVGNISDFVPHLLSSLVKAAWISASTVFLRRHCFNKINKMNKEVLQQNGGVQRLKHWKADRCDMVFFQLFTRLTGRMQTLWRRGVLLIGHVRRGLKRLLCTAGLQEWITQNQLYTWEQKLPWPHRFQTNGS